MVFYPFLHVFTEAPLASLIDSALARSGSVAKLAGNRLCLAQGSPLPLLTETTPAASPLPKPCHVNPIHPTICQGLIQKVLKEGNAPDHLQYIDDIIVWGNTTQEVYSKGKQITEILLNAGFVIERNKDLHQEIHFLVVKWQDGCHLIPTDMIDKIVATAPPTNKKETQMFLGMVVFWQMHIHRYSQLVNPLYQVIRKENSFEWGTKQQPAFDQVKQEAARAVALGPIRTGPNVQNVLYTSAGDKTSQWSLWQKAPGETRG